jgi:hypothetical protein
LKLRCNWKFQGKEASIWRKQPDGNPALIPAQLAWKFHACDCKRKALDAASTTTCLQLAQPTQRFDQAQNSTAAALKAPLACAPSSIARRVSATRPSFRKPAQLHQPRPLAVRGIVSPKCTPAPHRSHCHHPIPRIIRRDWNLRWSIFTAARGTADALHRHWTRAMPIAVGVEGNTMAAGWISFAGCRI